MRVLGRGVLLIGSIVLAVAGCQARHADPASTQAVVTTAAAVPASMPSVGDLPVRKEMPDPLIADEGSEVTTPEQWSRRRQEMKAILEEYEYGHMPPPPGNVEGREVQSELISGGTVKYRLEHLTFGPDGKLGFDVGIFSPAGAGHEDEAFATIVTLSFRASATVVSQYQAALRRGYAVAVIPYQQLGADNRNYRQTGFFSAYPDYDWNDFAAWAWGISRCVDFLDDDPTTDGSKIIATGVSRLGQAVLLAGAFDERIALVAPVGGGCAFRYSGKGRGGKQGIDEVEAQNTYWFGPKLVEFVGQTDKLPCDQHWLLALAAPRYFILCDALDDQYGSAKAVAESYLNAKPVYELLGVPDHLGIHFRPGRHGMNAEDWKAILDFADQNLMGKDLKMRFDEMPPLGQLN